MACENVIFELPDRHQQIDGQELLSWPHFLLKVLYTKVGIMLGKFWIHEKAISRYGKNIPEPPCHFLSIRSAIKNRDPLLLTKAKFLLPELLDSEDTGQDIHEGLLPKGCNISSIENMQYHRYYQQVKEWVETTVLN